MVSVVVTRNFQITLPRPVRRGLGISIGDSVIIEERKDEVVLRKIKKDPVAAAFGIWHGKVKEDSKEYVNKLRDSWKEREYA
ncbi:AbrB/MazE/SpoVT family DNA-binding domain-containing protein [Candidatus Woesearchaeota archaeon]|nr:AbrB/MazE/SpoVT family DNA-binding domain-containing protein [Candidatus Woesearchaeota archaeon]